MHIRVYTWGVFEMGTDKVYFSSIKNKLRSILINSNLPIDRLVEEIRHINFPQVAGISHTIIIPERQKISIITEIYTDIEILKFIQRIMIIEKEGYYGKFYNIPNINRLLSSFERCKERITKKELMSANTDDDYKRILDKVIPSLSYYFFNIFLKVDIVRSTVILRNHGETNARKIFEILHNMVSEICFKRSGKEIIWQLDGGIFEFKLLDKSENIKGLCHRAVVTGIHILHWLHAFNLFDTRLNELSEEIRLRIILIDSIPDEKFNVISRNLEELEKKHVAPNTVIISDTIHSYLNEKIQQNLYCSFIHNFREKYYEYTNSLER